MPEERQRSHAKTWKQRARANLQLLDQIGDGGGDRDVAKIAQARGGDRRQSERDRRSVTKTKRQCTKFPDRVPGMGETVDDHRQPGNPSILYSVF